MSVQATVPVSEPVRAASSGARRPSDGFADVLASVSPSRDSASRDRGATTRDSTARDTSARAGADRGEAARPGRAGDDRRTASETSRSQAGQTSSEQASRPADVDQTSRPVAAEKEARPADTDEVTSPDETAPQAPAGSVVAVLPGVPGDLSPVVSPTDEVTEVQAEIVERPVPTAQAAPAPRSATVDVAPTGPSAAAEVKGGPNLTPAPAVTAPAVADEEPSTAPAAEGRGVTSGVPAQAQGAQAQAQTAPAAPSPDPVVAAAPVTAPAATSAPVATAPVVSAPSPAPTPAPMVDQLGGHLRALAGARAGTHVLSVALDPDRLGDVRIVAHISAGQVRIDLAGANAEARAVLRETLDDLRRDLQSAGLNAELGLNDDRPGAERHKTGSSRGPDRAPDDGAPSTDTPTPTAVPTDSVHGLDLIV
ncbi:MAG: flagellar hook-length control protein FliK [Micrococcales bacterium]|nr:flagellar hook-length control protein FliK [Micrococcales bacterium]